MLSARKFRGSREWCVNPQASSGVVRREVTWTLQPSQTESHAPRLGDVRHSLGREPTEAETKSETVMSNVGA